VSARCARWETLAVRQWLRVRLRQEWPTRRRPEAQDLASATSIQKCMVRLCFAHCRCQYMTVWCGIMTRRLTAQDWIDFGLTALAREGSDALKADVLARKLGVSRGSFYWHFADLDAFHARVIARWKQVATEGIIADIERYRSRDERLDALLRHAFGHGA